MAKGQRRAAVASCFLIAVAMHFLFCRWSTAILRDEKFREIAPLVRIRFYKLYAADFIMPTMAAVLGVVVPLVLIAVGVFLALGDPKKPLAPPGPGA